MSLVSYSEFWIYYLSIVHCVKKVSKYKVFSGPYFPVFSPNTGKYRAQVAHVFSCEFCEISKNTFSYRTPPVAASVKNQMCL